MHHAAWRTAGSPQTCGALQATSCLKAAHLCKGHLTQPLRTGRGRLICIAAMAKGSQSKRVVLWFRDDLRLRDNYIVASAAKMVKAGQASEVRTQPPRLLYRLDGEPCCTDSWMQSLTQILWTRPAA